MVLQSQGTLAFHLSRLTLQALTTLNSTTAAVTAIPAFANREATFTFLAKV